MKCAKCGSGTRMQVQAVISAPGELTDALSKRNLRRKDVYILGVLWETADYICTNLECQHVFDGYGNYVTRLKNENQELRAELDAKNAALENVRLRAELERATSMPTVSEAARNIALEKRVDELQTELDALKIENAEMYGQLMESLLQEPVGVFADVNRHDIGQPPRWEQMVPEAYDGVECVYLYAAPIPPSVPEITESEIERLRNEYVATDIDAAISEQKPGEGK